MSSTQPPFPGPSSSSPQNQGPPHATSASTLLFGFLVSALSIFAVFMSFAIVWNRLIARRHAIEASLASGPTLESPRLRRPKMRDVWIVPDTQSPPWSGIKPVAAHKCVRPSSSQTTQTEPTSSFWRRCIWSRIPPEITYLFYLPIPQQPHASNDTDASRFDLPHGSDVQITLLIAMPYVPQSSGAQEKHRTFHEMAFATTDVVCHDPGS